MNVFAAKVQITLSIPKMICHLFNKILKLLNVYQKNDLFVDKFIINKSPLQD